MKVELVIRTDSLTIVDRVVDAPMSVDAVIEALREGTSACKHLKDLPFAAICIQARPHDPMRAPHVKRTPNQEVNGVA